MNILTLNLMHDLVIGSRTVEEARDMYAETAAAFTMGRPAPYAQRLEFAPPAGDTTDPDEATIGETMAHQSAEKAKDLLGGEERPG